ncbi:penicillin acylase family protein [Sphingomonas sp. So64.6b]|uniref:penicillin acylase family protein n=1 Tax=Sphingomonas sp. So64.6b TaxID=2997354 RepID=UPI001601B3D9|nr:penicillin acylase family protein [Sphingomonas sp. So64.6b]QNA85304.1 penicillin acylase family protein [Sphingomonas sp. So64.6b]
MKRALFAGLAAALLPTIAAAEVRQDGWNVRGLTAPAEIIVDRWGLAHIYAASERDTYFLQGYNAARDRLWQIDLWRKRGLGLLSASLSPDYVKQDRAARLFLYRGDMKAEWARYAPGSEARYTAFAEGINAYVDEIAAGGKPLPVEFTLSRSRPDHWRGDEIVRIRSNTLVSNAKQEVLRARVACTGGLAADRLRVRLYPDHTPEMPKGLDPCVVTPEVMADYLLATGEVAFTPGAAPAPAPLDQAAETARLDGSNNWVIAPSHTATGRPILANDPHRSLLVPSLRYVVHLEAPGLSLIGAGEPATPGVALGHNGHGAFGLTIFGTDQEDLYVYALKPGDPDSYRYRDGWEKMTIVRESIPVKGGAPVNVELRFTRHGPLLFSDPANGRAFALRTAWSEPGASGYAAASWLASAKSWSDFRKAADHWGTPPLNLIWADTTGSIGWVAAGLAPIRRNWDGLLPVPGDGRYEWRGFQKAATLPQVKDPTQGWFASANEMNLPPGYAATPPSFEWGERSRMDRISKVIASKPHFSIDDAVALQMDTHSELAPRLIALSKRLQPADPDTRRALTRLAAWDGDLSAESIAATIYETWATQHLGRVLAAHSTTPAAQAVIDLGSPDAALRILETRDPLLGKDPVGSVDAILLESLDATLADLRERLGPDMATWQWGRLHTIQVSPAIAPLADPAQRQAMTVGPLGIGGSGSTPAVAAYRGGNFAVVHGPSVRLAIDVGDWDKSVFLNMPGQSGDPGDPHYRDLFPGWAAGHYAPLSYTRAAVDRAAERIIRLKPAP